MANDTKKANTVRPFPDWLLTEAESEYEIYTSECKQSTKNENIFNEFYVTARQNEIMQNQPDF